MNVTIFDGVRWIQGNVRVFEQNHCEIAASGHIEGQPFGTNAVLTLVAVDADEKQTVSAKACLVRAYQREGVWKFVCRLENAQARALAGVLAPHAA